MDTLIQNHLSGDASAFSQLVTTYQALAYKIAQSLLHNEEEATDVVQDAFIKVWRALPQYRGGHFQHWLARIVINTCYDLLRTPHRRQNTSLDDLTDAADPREFLDPGEQPEAYVERQEVQQWLQRGLAALPVHQRTAVILFDVEGYSYHEIVTLTGVPIGTVKSRLNRGRISLRNFLLRHKVLTVAYAGVMVEK